MCNAWSHIQLPMEIDVTGQPSRYRVGIIGCGNIASRYLTGLARFQELEVVACTDLRRELAESLATQYGIAVHESPDSMLADPDIDLIVNITPPNAHFAVSAAAMRARKHVYVEKPMAPVLEDALRLIEIAEEQSVMLGSAPDTFLGSAGQTARAALDSGLIGEPIGAIAVVRHSKAELWHPDPTFLFQPGGGPALDLGPYYIASLVNLLGPVESVSGFTRIGASPRSVTAPDRRVESIDVTTPTHMSGSLEFRSGAIATLMMSFDVWETDLPHIEVYGTEGTLSVPNPDLLDGDVRFRPNGQTQWRTLDPVLPPSGPIEDGFLQRLRGTGVADLVGAIEGAPHRASDRLAAHVLEVLQAVQTSSDTATVVRLSTTCERPAVGREISERTKA